MKISLWTRYGALNSQPVFESFKKGAEKLGHKVYENKEGCDIDVIWSVLWSGRMLPNEKIWNEAKRKKKPVIILEVGGIKRNKTWKVGLNGVNRKGILTTNKRDIERPSKLGLELKSWVDNNKNYVLVCGQHGQSQQWKEMPKPDDWARSVIRKLQKYTNRTILLRPHPRFPLKDVSKEFSNVELIKPKKDKESYDDFPIDFSNVHATVNWSSNPGIHSIINGVPAFVGPDSLAYDVGNLNLSSIENPRKPSREKWLIEYAHTEYTLDEIENGIPLYYLTSRL